MQKSREKFYHSWNRLYIAWKIYDNQYPVDLTSYRKNPSNSRQTWGKISKRISPNKKEISKKLSLKSRSVLVVFFFYEGNKRFLLVWPLSPGKLGYRPCSLSSPLSRGSKLTRLRLPCGVRSAGGKPQASLLPRSLALRWDSSLLFIARRWRVIRWRSELVIDDPFLVVSLSIPRG